MAASGGRAPEWLETSSAPPVGRHVLDPLDLAAEPQPVEELDQRAVHQALDALRAAPVVDLALGLDARQVGPQVGARSGLAGGRERGATILCHQMMGSGSRAASWRRTVDAGRRTAKWSRAGGTGRVGTASG